MSSIYYCTNENNKCPKKEECKRYLEIDMDCCATLFKRVCTKDNNYILFMKAEKEKNIQ